MDAINHRCEDFRKAAGRYLDGELDAAERAALEAQARACPDCGRALDQMTEIMTLCAELDEGLQVPPTARSAWRGAIRAEARLRKKPARGFVARSVAAIAAAMVLLTAGTLALRTGGLLPSQGAVELAGQAQYAEMPSLGGGTAYRLSPSPMSTMSPMSAKQSDDVRAYEADGAIDRGGSVAGDVVGEENSGVVVLRSANRSIESTRFDADLGAVRDLVSEYGAYFESSSQSGTELEPGQRVGRSASMTVRVPTGQLDAFLTALDAVGQIVGSDDYAEDITDQYADTQARLTTLKAQRSQLDAMLQTATAIEDLIAITDKQREVQTEIDSIEGQIKRWDGRVSYAAVSLWLTEVADGNRFNTIETTLGQRIAQGFADSLNWLVGFAQDALVVLVMAGPQLVIIIPVLIIIIVIVRAVRRRRRR
ncbi:MAG: DUF4349 domain-containing protein [Clostridiales bacterium]|nr:DUF4349 domain-containing protein [Clostridiales bacterium]